MSKLETNNILLPEAQIDIFATDDSVVNAANELIDDWRFARVCIHVEQGDVDAAITAYQDAKAPNMIILQTDDIGEGFTDKLEQLAAHCDADTDAIVIGPVNDVDLYRQLVDMGVSDYLVYPMEKDGLADVLARALVDQIGITGSRLISYCGAKGGVGASVIAQSAAWLCAQTLHQKTVLIDFAAGWSSNSVGMGFEPSTTLIDAIHAAQDGDDDSVDRMMFKASDRLHVLASGSDTMLEEHIEARHIEAMLDYIMARYPVVIFDGSGASPDVKKMIIRRSSQANIVTNASLPSLRLARVLFQEVKALRGSAEENIEMILNMQALSKTHEASIGDIEEALEHKLSAKIPYDPKGFMAAESESKNPLEVKETALILESQLLPLLTKLIALPQSKEKGSSEAVGFVGKIMGALKE